MMFGKFLAAPGAGRHRNGSGAERFSAGDISWRIADNVDLLCRKFTTMPFFCPGLSERPELITIVMIIGEGAEFKKVPNAIMIELELRSPGNVAGQKSKDDMFPRFQLFQQLEHAGQQFTSATR